MGSYIIDTLKIDTLKNNLFSPTNQILSQWPEEIRESARPEVAKVVRVWHPFSLMMQAAIVVGIAFAIRGAVIHKVAFKIAGGSLVGGSILLPIVGACYVNKRMIKINAHHTEKYNHSLY